VTAAAGTPAAVLMKKKKIVTRTIRPLSAIGCQLSGGLP
jgi:hypothetical protein